MAATDKLYRPQRILDVVFGVSCGLLLAVTLWMLADDYLAGWKKEQRLFRDVEATLAEREAVTSFTKLGDLQPEVQTIKDARQALKDKQQELRSKERSLNAERELEKVRYQGIKADYDSLMTYYNAAIKEYEELSPTSSSKSRLGRTVRNQRQELDQLAEKLDQAQRKKDEIEDRYRKEVRNEIETAEKTVSAAEDRLKQKTAKFDLAAKQAARSNWTIADTIRALPIIDGFASPTKIQQLWLPDLTIDYGGFRDVPRYDRCTTCHLGIDRPAFDKLTLARLNDTSETSKLNDELTKAHAILVERKDAGEKIGFNPDNLPGKRSLVLPMVLVAVFLALSLTGAALLSVRGQGRAGVNVLIGGLIVTLIAGGIGWSMAPTTPEVQAVKLTEGQVSQFAAHPRLDLFVDANSAHPKEKFGCTSCHAGQGSATDFNLASHTPNDAQQKQRWERDHHYHSSHFWDFPMLSQRFTESSCLKCHHEVTDLIRNGNKEEAPKLLRGYNLVREFGCFGCHEIQGLKGGRTVGPDLRLEPSPALAYLTASEQEKAKSDPANPPGAFRKVGPSLRRLAEKTNEEWTRKWLFNPRGFRPDTRMPHFYELSTNGKDYLANSKDDKEQRLQRFPATEIHSISHYLFTESRRHLGADNDRTRSHLATDARMGDTYRASILSAKGNPKGNLLTLQKKLTEKGLDDRTMKDLLDLSKRFGDLAILSVPMKSAEIGALVAEQRRFQDSLRELHRKAKKLKEGKELDDTRATIAATGQDLESVTTRLIDASKPVPISEQIVNENGVALPRETVDKLLKKAGNPIEGRRLFTERGCLACHAHEGTTVSQRKQNLPPIHSEANHGPELTRIVAKLSPDLGGKESARRFVVQWLLNPNVYHPRTRMPITYLTPEQANHIATWLLSQKVTDWQGTDPAAPTREELVHLTRTYLLRAPGITPDEVDKHLPLTEGAITDASQAKPLAITSAKHGLKTGDQVTIAGVLGNTQANGRFTITVTDENTFTLDGVDAREAHAYTSGGFWLKEGTPTSLPASALSALPRDADEHALTGPINEDVLKWYIGRKAVGRLGCYGCHDIPGYETFKLIGTGLNDWGRKDPERLAFEDGELWAHEHFNIVATRMTRQDAEDRIRALAQRAADSLPENDRARMLELLEKSAKGPLAEREKEELRLLRVQAERGLSPVDYTELANLKTRLDAQPRLRELEARGEANLNSKELRELKDLRQLKLWGSDNGKAPYEEIFFQALQGHSREGFLHLKLLQPRVFDYQRRAKWEDRLRMPQFRFARTRKRPGETLTDFNARQSKEEAEAREAVMTFILGLVGEPTPAKYLHQPSPEKRAEAQGRKVLDQFNCNGCHQIRPGSLEFRPTDKARDYLGNSYKLATRGDALITDHTFLGHNAWFGLPSPHADRLVAFGTDAKQEKMPSAEGKGDRPAYLIRLTDALRFHGLDGVARDIPAANNAFVPENAVLKVTPTYGGTFTKLMVEYLAGDYDRYPFSQEYKQKFEKNRDNARSALPPPLIREGERVQPDWLYQFLLNPTPIRPQNYMMLRMPRFNLSPEDTRALVNYFAASAKTSNPGAGVQYPYTTVQQRDPDYWAQRNREYIPRLEARQKTVAAELKKDEAELPKAKKAAQAAAKKAPEVAKFRQALTTAQQEAQKAQLAVEAAEKNKAKNLEAKRAALEKAQQKLTTIQGELATAEKDKPAEAKVLKEQAELEGRIQASKEELGTLKERVKDSHAYSRDALRLMNHPELCIKCHDIGDRRSQDVKGPNLAGVAGRLRPEWTMEWIANPRRMFPYAPVMQQNFPNSPDPLKWGYQPSFVGSPRDQTRALRDALMDLQRLMGTPAPDATRGTGGGK